ncbi:probable proteasome inhibitor [Euphorbia lathyris]|uniref:probable proteasome inhibitor n=1 Tax=Euphorbia lathyris TaxID=212925 RepID=UPI0033138623
MANKNSVMAVIRAARPSFRNNSDKIAFVVNASFLSSGYVLTATGPPAFAENALYSSSTDEVGFDHWNDCDSEYAFVYMNPEKDSKKVLVKCLVMNDKLLVDALADGTAEQVHLEIPIGDFVGEEGGGSNVSTQFKNLDKLVKDLDDHIFTKLHGSSKDSSSGNQQPRSESSDSSRHGRNETSIRTTEPRDPQNDHPGVLFPPIPAFIGDDLAPGPGAGMYPARGGFGGGGMLMGPNDPRWLRGDPQNFPGGPLGVPPGARFDPYGPPGVPGFEPNRFVRNPRRPGRGTHPDLEPFGDADFI